MYDFLQGPVSTRAQALSILGSILLMITTVYLIKKDKLRSGYSILWFLISGVILILSLFTSLLFIFSNLTGIFYAPIAIFSILIVGIILIEMHFSVILTSHERKTKKLSQEISLLKQKIEKVTKKHD